MSSEHLISDHETRQIADGFLEASPWLGDVTEQRIIIGPSAPMVVELREELEIDEDFQLPQGNRWSWKLHFSDPSGGREYLSHETVLKGLKTIVYGDHEGPKAWGLMRIRQWYTETTQERLKLSLSTPEKSLICQYALYGKLVFPTGEDSPSGRKIDFFEEQRSNATTDSEI